MKKMSFNEIKGKLSNDEMKRIMAGTATACTTGCNVTGQGKIGCINNGSGCKCLWAGYECV